MNFLKVTFAYVVIFLLALPNQLLHSLAHVPEIMAHYEVETKLIVKKESFITFFIQHITDNEHNQTHHSDDEVPCKHQHSSVANTWILNFSDRFEAIPEAINLLLECSINGFSPVNGKISCYSSTIWQPPKLV